MFKGIRKFFKDRQERRDMEKVSIDAQKRVWINRRIRYEEEAMTLCYCKPFGMKNICSKGCVHFQPGYILDAGSIRMVSPKCKLWR